MSLNDELASLNHEELVELSGLVHKLIRWDNRMSWNEALQQAYDRVMADRDWMQRISSDNYTSY